ncbi:MAG: Ig domain-containing protein, partial [Gemmatimonadota bacterium]
MQTITSDRSPRAVARRSRPIARVALSLVAAGAVACTESIPPTPISSLRIAPPSDSFFLGRTTATVPFTVTMLDANNTEIRDGRPITYSSQSPTLFTVDSKTGVLTGTGIGAGAFRATVDGRFIEAAVKIIHPVDRVQLNSGDFSLTVGATRQLVPNLVSADGSAISGRAIVYASSNPSVASVTTSGLVTAVTEGTSTLTATVEGKSASAVVVLWSAEAAKSQWVRAEADAARSAGSLIQATLDG